MASISHVSDAYLRTHHYESIASNHSVPYPADCCTEPAARRDSYSSCPKPISNVLATYR